MASFSRLPMRLAATADLGATTVAKPATLPLPTMSVARSSATSPGVQSRFEIHTSSILTKTKEAEGSVTQDLKGQKPQMPYNERQSASGTVSEITDKDTSFDPHNVDPKEEIREMKEETPDHQSPIEWSGANENVSPQTKEEE
ncbi:uncharacterized protein BYT42DRAFT_641514 [Radiomyces spectabilis]|uniref:uncharacterized protein n=1 Tax=Radiomyces spectabilis TaxID=64574 RepID=UPI00221F1980|nr:uncharacterized protein BYT42DRAFT_641514 [Radiomyces spectabilis]KAI8390960.1 hypothetical protein BYT42DRAFT_641514 [Radiomyces spectabilis]